MKVEFSLKVIKGSLSDNDVSMTWEAQTVYEGEHIIETGLTQEKAASNLADKVYLTACGLSKDQG